MTQVVSTNTYGVAKYVVSSSPSQGNFTTIQAAIDAATVGSTIWITPGTYSENVTLSDGVSITTYTTANLSESVIVTGTFTYSGAGSSVISGINFQGSPALSVEDFSTCTLDFIRCGFNTTGSNIIDFNAPNAVINAVFSSCTFTLSGDDTTLYDINCSGTTVFKECSIYTPVSSTPSVAENAIVQFYYCYISNALEFSGMAVMSATHCDFTCNTANQLAFIDSSTGNLFACDFTNGIYESLNVGTGCTATIDTCQVNSSASHPITGSGTINFGLITTASSTNIIPNSSTVTPESALIGSLDLYAPLPTSSGGTGLPLSSIADGTLLIGNGTGFSANKLTAGANISIDNSSPGNITLSASAFSNFIVSPTPGQGSYTTIGAAVAAASSGDTIFVTDGTYNETVTLIPGINITALPSSGLNKSVNFTGQFIFSGGGNVFISEMNLQSDNAISVVFNGSSPGSLTLSGCLINCTSNNSMLLSSSSSGASISIYNSLGDLATNNNVFLVTSSPGSVTFLNAFLANEHVNYNPLIIGGGANVSVINSTVATGFSLSSASTLYVNNSVIEGLLTAVNITGDSTATFINSEVYGNTNTSIASMFTSDGTGLFSFSNTGLSGSYNPLFSGGTLILYSSVYTIGSTTFTRGTSSLSYTDLIAGHFSTNTLYVANGISTDPASSQPSYLSVGSAYQNNFGFDVVLTVYLAVTAATSADILLGVTNNPTPVQQTIISSLTTAALTIIPVTIYLPDGFYALLTTSGTISVTISGQQAMAV